MITCLPGKLLNGNIYNYKFELRGSGRSQPIWLVIRIGALMNF